MSVSEGTQQIGLIGILLLVFVFLCMFFGRECDRESTRQNQMRREAKVKCVQAGKDPLLCSQAFQY